MGGDPPGGAAGLAGPGGRRLKRDARLAGLAFLAVTSLGWGLNWPAMKVLLREWPPLFARGTSGLCAALLLAAIATARGERLAVPRSAWPQLAWGGAFNIFAWMGLGTLAMRWLAVNQAALLVYTMPAWATLLAWPLRGQRPGPASLAGLALCFAGVGLLFLGSSAALQPGQGLGVAFALAAALLFALGTTVLRPAPLPPLVGLAWQLVVGCAPMLVLGLALEHPQLAALSWRGAAVMAYMTLVPMGLCYLAWFAALARLSPTAAAIGTLLTPVIGVVAAAISLGEPLGLREAAALALTLGGVALALRARQSRA
ncbi:DMT family transporter [Ramlibacter aquaticus]|uniref:DMT family transporter n=1 Tax=Ramlibacter aquaticus TaxID=2780094 RepID=UPI00389ACDB5